jgi:hypothetical protein
MKIPRIPLWFVMGMIGAMGLGFAGARWAESNPYVANALTSSRASGRISSLINPFLQCFALIGTLFVGAERLTGARRTSLGLGRWTWVFCGAYVIVMLSRDSFLWITRQENPNLTIPADQDYLDWLRQRLVWGPGLQTPILLASWLAMAVAGYPRDREADACEWSGRAYGALCIGWTLTWLILKAMNN